MRPTLLRQHFLGLRNGDNALAQGVDGAVVTGVDFNGGVAGVAGHHMCQCRLTVPRSLVRTIVELSNTNQKFKTRLAGARRSSQQHNLGILVRVPREERSVGAGQGRRIGMSVARPGVVGLGNGCVDVKLTSPNIFDIHGSTHMVLAKTATVAHRCLIRPLRRRRRVKDNRIPAPQPSQQVAVDRFVTDEIFEEKCDQLMLLFPIFLHLSYQCNDGAQTRLPRVSLPVGWVLPVRRRHCCQTH